ncbi:MAG: mechanosensitive ion channel family protein, partial [Treponema sp.]|nr:mechanosensitive ion channel family protein [Treponema sp.]
MLNRIYTFWINHNATIFENGGKILGSIIILLIGLLISKGLKKLVKKATYGKLNMDHTISSILKHTIGYGIFIICTIMILNIFGFNTSSLLALLGAAGIAVGLALKDTLGNIAAGISLLFLGSYKIGEFIEFGSFNGTVKEINLFNTILETPDGIYISAPNSSIWGSPVRNFSRNGKRRMELPLRLSYSDSIETAFLVLNKIVEDEQRILKDPAHQIIVQSIQDSHVNIIVRAWALNQDFWDVYWFQMRNIKQKI